MGDFRDSPIGSPLRVVHIASGDLWGGAEAQLYGLAKELNKSAEVELSVILLNQGILSKRLQEQGVEVTVLDETKLNGLQVLQMVYRLLANIRPSIVHTHRKKENVIGSLATLFLRNCKSIRTVHGAAEFSIEPWQLRKMSYRLLDWFCARFLQDRIVAVSDELGTVLAGQFAPQKVKVIQNGVDVNELVRQSRLPVDLPGPKEAFKVAFVGRLVPVKRVDVFIDAAKELLMGNKDRYRFYIFGDGPLAKKLDAQIHASGIGQYVFRMGFRDDLSAYLARMNVLVMTSDHEGLPMTLLQAVAIGIPVIAHAVGGIPQVLGQESYGELVSKQQAAEYAKRVRALAENGDLASRKVKNGSAHISRLYSVHYGAKAYTELYRGLVS